MKVNKMTEMTVDERLKAISMLLSEMEEYSRRPSPMNHDQASLFELYEVLNKLTSMQGWYASATPLQIVEFILWEYVNKRRKINNKEMKGDNG